MIDGFITYAEVKLTIAQIIEQCIQIAYSGMKVGITAPSQYVSSILHKIFELYDVVGVNDSIPVGEGSICVLSDSIENINKSGIDIVFCDRDSIIGRNSLPLLGGLKMIRAV